MHLVALVNPESWYARDLARAASARGHTLAAMPFAGLTAHVQTGSSGIWGQPDAPDESIELEADAIIVRTMPPGSLEQVVFRMNLLGLLETKGVPVLNSARAVECAVDKYLTTARLTAAGLPVPETCVCETEEAALDAFAKLGGDVVVKPIFGAEGRGILRVSDPDLAQRVFRTLQRLDAVLYLQKFVPHRGFDVRVMVLDGKVLAGMRRVSETDFRTNVARDARAEPIQLTAQQEDWAIRAAAAVGCRLAGVDLLYGRDGEGYVIEVNGVPGWRALRRVTDRDVAMEVICSLENQQRA